MSADPQPRREPPTRKLSQSGSFLLDLIRFTAAVVVLFHHFVGSRFAVDWKPIGVWGHEAVCVFFVLSGFVIRFITVTRTSTVKDYWVDRASRVYSVVIPALAFTVLVEGFAQWVRPAVYGAMRDPFLWRDVPVQLLANVTFTAQMWGYEVSPLTNSPFWSLSYECIYYLVYGLVFYRLRRRWVWVALVLLVAGPNIALLALVWLLGARACDLYVWLSGKEWGVRAAAGLLVLTGGVMGVLRHPIVWLIRATDHEARLAWMTRVTAGLTFQPHLIFYGSVPWISQVSFSFLMIGLATGVFLVWGLLVLDRHQPGLPKGFARWTRLVADSTFTLYLFHLPLLVLVVLVVGHPIVGRLNGVLVLLGIIAVCVPLAMGLDRLKLWMRDALRHRTGRGKSVDLREAAPGNRL